MVNTAVLDISEDAVASWQARLHADNFSPRTIRSYASDVRQARAYYQDDNAEGWEARFMAAQKEEGISNATIIRRLAALRSLGKYQNNKEVLNTYRPGKIEPRTAHPLPGGMEDVDRMIKECRTDNQRLVIGLCGYAGLRIEEAISVGKDNVDLRGKVIKIQGKGGKWRRIPMRDVLWNMIVPYYVEAHTANDASPFVRYSNGGARAMITSTGNAAGVARKVSSHDLRATFATHVYNQTLDIVLVQTLLGHASVDTTRVYIGLDETAMHQAINKAFGEDS